MLHLQTTRTAVSRALAALAPFAPFAGFATFAALGFANTAQAQSASGPAAAASAATPLAEITNTATRTERRVDSVPGTVTVHTATDVQERAARDLKDLFRNEVDLTVRAASPRFTAAGGVTGRAGNEGVNVRGLEGNQVLMLVDGIRVPNSFSFGAFATGRVDHLSLDAAQTVEVLRGPASTQFGSDGLAGAVSLRTLDPADLLKTGRSFGGFVRGGGTTLDDSLAATVAGAWREGAWQGLLLAGQRVGKESRTEGRNEALDSTRTAPNPLDYRQQTLLAKAYFSPTPTQRLGTTLESVRRRLTVDVFSARTPPAVAPATLPATAVLDLDARDRLQRDRVSLDYRFDDLNARFLQQAEARLYVQDAKTRQVSFEDRFTAADRVRDNVYRERVTGFSAQGQASFSAPFTQRVSAGIDASRTEVTAVRDGTVPPFGETFPVKPFPDTDYRVAGAFVQSEIETGRLTLIPALRLDHYRLEPSASGYVGGAVVSLSDQAVTPRLGAVWRATDTLAPYAQWSRGFRAPTPDQVNNGFTNVASGYRSVGNPSLKAERAESFELGLRGTHDVQGAQGAFRWQIAAYDNRYRDFISQETVSGSFTPADPAVFQFINLASAQIRGAELRTRWQVSPAWQLNLAAATARGHSTRAGVDTPLASVEPWRASLGLRFDAGIWTWRADVLHADGKDPARIPAATPPSFAPPGYTALDLGLSVKPLPTLTVALNVDNVFDKTYWRWSDVRGVAGNSTVKDAFTAPGRTASLTARLDF